MKPRWTIKEFYICEVWMRNQWIQLNKKVDEFNLFFCFLPSSNKSAIMSVLKILNLLPRKKAKIKWRNFEFSNSKAKSSKANTRWSNVSATFVSWIVLIKGNKCSELKNCIILTCLRDGPTRLLQISLSRRAPRFNLIWFFVFPGLKENWLVVYIIL